MLDGLQTAIHDPLWLLGRQWQTGELDGDDAGSLIDARLDLGVAPMTRLRPGGVDGDDDADVIYREGETRPPLETLVERERIRHVGPDGAGESEDTQQNVRLAAEAGAQFQRLVSVHTDLDASTSVFPEWVRLEATATAADSETGDGEDADGEDTGNTTNGEDVTNNEDADGEDTGNATNNEDATNSEDADGEDTGNATNNGDAARRLLAVLGGRSLDGDVLYDQYAFTDIDAFLDAVDEGDVPLPADLDGEDVATDSLEGFWTDVVVPYREWYESVYREPTDDDRPACWNDDRLEYEFAISTGTGSDETVFEADGYEGGRLDWYAVDENSEASLDATGANGEPDGETRSQSLIPAPTTFPGMPAERWWEFEDDGLDLSALEAAPEDLSRLLLLEFALVYGNDWFTLPADLPVGSLTHVEAFELETSFNETITVEDAAIEDDDETASWNMYSFGLDDAGDQRGLFLPPVIEDVLESEAIEEVRFGRDETANVAWAVEKSVEGMAGEARDRATETATDPTTTVPVETATDADVAYQLMTDVPANWFPMLPRRETDLEAVSFHLGRLHGGDDEYGDPLGRILDGVGALPEEEVPRIGKTVRRSYAMARWTDGSTHCWSGRRVSAGRDKTASGLAFDVLVDPHSPEETDAIGEPEPFPEGVPIEEPLEDDGFSDWDDPGDDPDDGHDDDGGDDSDTGEEDDPDTGADSPTAGLPTDTDPLSITDLSIDTPGGPRDHLEAEFVVFENESGDTVDLDGWRVEDRAGHTYVFEALELDPGATVHLRTGSGTDTATERFWGRRMQLWNADGDTILVFDDAGNLVAEYTYPVRPPDVREGPLEVREVQAETEGPIWENLDQEAVSFANEGDEPLDVSGWRVEEQAGFRYSFPDESVIQPGEEISLVTGIGTDTETVYHWGYRRPIWNRSGDTVSVFDTDDQLVLRRSY